MFELSTWAVNHDADILTKSLFTGKRRVRSKAKKFKSNSGKNESSTSTPQKEKLQHFHDNVSVSQFSSKVAWQPLNLTHLDENEREEPLNGESVSRKRKKALKDKKKKSTVQSKKLHIDGEDVLPDNNHSINSLSNTKDTSTVKEIRTLSTTSLSSKKRQLTDSMHVHVDQTRKATESTKKLKSSVQSNDASVTARDHEAIHVPSIENLGVKRKRKKIKLNKILSVDELSERSDTGIAKINKRAGDLKHVHHDVNLEKDKGSNKASLNRDSGPHSDSVKLRKSDINNPGSSVKRKGNKDIKPVKVKRSKLCNINGTNNDKNVLCNVVKESSIMTSSKVQSSVNIPEGFVSDKKSNRTEGLVFNVSKLQQMLYVHEESAKSQKLGAGSRKSKTKQIKSPLDPDKLSNSDDTLPISRDVTRQSTPSSSSASSLKSRMLNQLNSARFRYLNEQLYTCTGKEAFTMFDEDREAFHVYHTGFQGQVTKWPVNPLNLIIRYIKSRPQSLIIADFGCGDAQLAQSVQNKVHSFDLVALNKNVTACDMSKVPLRDCSVDLGVFCLSLMGTTLTEYLQEANRVIKLGGVLKIAEVISRFQKLSQFTHKMSKLGFTLIDKDESNQMFVMMDFKKEGKPNINIPQITLNPCVYKRR